ncbi:CHAT domain-containing protein [Micromonospora sp. NBC_01813]|uniref:CHAT domain-containing protein n=1 Tax=Micromonospora sp. NBC_01813 TaxID=2975988 RepID=UPI002DD9159A|nr:CHAT domain-containing protein [Micromonospora sp. NBC_01813]WSA07528.1 CHAT domain-containing protein [Micromonospora sp. NBC_01813]
MRDLEGHDVAVRRIMRRDDLLTLAAAADTAVGIVRMREAEALTGVDGSTLFDLALRRHIRLATGNAGWAEQAQAWDHAAVLVRYCELAGTELTSPYSAVDMHARSLRLLEENQTRPGLRPLDRDLTLGAFNRYHAARDLRLAGDIQAARDLARRSPQDLYGCGAEPHIAHFQYELGATYIEQGDPRPFRRQLRELRGYWEGDRAKAFSTHHRFEFIDALVSWYADPGSDWAGQCFAAAIDLVDTAHDHADVSGHDGVDHQGVRELSLVLAAAEHLVLTGGDLDRAVDLALRALAAAERVRARWRVIARSRAPLAEAFHRVYADVCLLAHRMDTAPAARLGLRAALSAKSTGFAARVRDGLTFDDNPLISNLLTQILDVENPSPGAMTSTVASRQAQLDGLRKDLEEAVSPMLADTVLPPPTDLDDVVCGIGPRYALDYVELTDNLAVRAFFRTLIEPGGAMTFDRFDPGDDFRVLFEQARVGQLTGSRDVVDPPVPGLRDDGRLDFRTLADQVLPRRLTEEILPGCTVDAPAQLLISAHSWLSLVPWAALRTGSGTRLVEQALISQSPVLTCLSGELPPPVSGAALVRLVGSDEPVQIDGRPLSDLDIAQERAAWGLPPDTVGVALSSCDLDLAADPDTGGGGVPVPHGGRFADALRQRGRWQFLHIAAHGGGQGFGQYLALPGERLSAARALGLRWPESVLMASCHVGLVRNDHGAEPLSLVMALLTGGARCVVAGIDSVDDAGTGRMAAAMVRAARAPDPVSIDVALRDAQLAELRAGTPESGWALLSAYVR